MNESERKKITWQIITFSVLVLVVAWIAPMFGGSPSSPGLGFILWGMAPLLTSLLIRTATKDWSDLGVNHAFGKNPRWYLVSFFGLPVLMLLTLLVGVLLSLSSVTEFSLVKFLQTFLTALPIFFIFAIFEEVGWRGYLSPKLETLGLNRFAASAIVAVVWATWHLPYIRDLTWVYSSENLASFIPRFYLVCFALSILFGALRNVTGNFWTAILIHAVGNAFGHPLAAEYIRYAAGMDFLSSISNGLIFVVLTGLLGAIIERRKPSG